MSSGTLSRRAGQQHHRHDAGTSRMASAIRTSSSSIRFSRWRQQLGLVVWVLIGLLSYGSVWMIMITDDHQSYTTIIAHRQMKEQERQRSVQEQAVLATEQQQQVQQRDLELVENVQHHQHEDYKPPEETTLKKNLRQRRKRRNISGDGNKSGSDGTRTNVLDDHSFWGLSLCFLILSYVRIRLEPSRRRRRRRRREAATSLMRALTGGDGGSTSSMRNAATQQEAALQTLRRINRDREVRGETLITLDAYQALRMALLQDRTLLRGLAGHTPPPLSSRRGATPEQLETCQQLTISQDDAYQGDCCIICLASFETNDEVRILPCRHSYHRDCIDHWFQQSILCPICKHSLDHNHDDDDEERPMQLS